MLLAGESFEYLVAVRSAAQPFSPQRVELLVYVNPSLTSAFVCKLAKWLARVRVRAYERVTQRKTIADYKPLVLVAWTVNVISVMNGGRAAAMAFHLTADWWNCKLRNLLVICKSFQTIAFYHCTAGATERLFVDRFSAVGASVKHPICRI